jgi:hypothetical protein
MKHILHAALTGLLLIVLLPGCATVLSKSTYPLSITTTPGRADVRIINQDGLLLFQGSTPLTIPLAASAGFFRKAHYQITLSRQGYMPQTFSLKATLDGWYLGNFLIGGPLGLLVIDPLSGAMWKLPTQHFLLSLQPLDEASLKIMSIDELPDHLRDKLEPLTEENIKND